MLTRAEFLRQAGRGVLAMAATAAMPAWAKATVRAPEDFGARGDGSTNDTAAFRKALANGASVRLTPGRSYFLNQLAIGPGDHVWSEPGAATVVGPTKGKTFMIRRGGTLEGFKLAGKPEYHIQHEAGAGAIDGLTLRGLTLTGGDLGVYLFGYGQRNKNVLIENCRFEGVENPAIFEHLEDSDIRGNSFTGAGGANVMFRLAQRCKVSGGSMDGGTTGLSFLGQFSNAGFSSGTFENNVVDGVRVLNMREEAISFDTNGTGVDCLCRERAKVASKAADDRYYYVTLTAPTGSWRGTSGKFANAYLCVFGGAATGAVCRADYNESARFQFLKRSGAGTAGMSAAEYANLAKGDDVVVGLPFIGNAVLGTDIDMTTGADEYGIGILYYGMSFRNRANANRVRMKRSRNGDFAYAMTICSLSAIDSRTSYVSGIGDLRAAPCVGNLFQDNAIDGGDMVLNYNDFGNRTRPYISRYNRTVRNTVRGGRRIVEYNDDLSENDVIVR